MTTCSWSVLLLALLACFGGVNLGHGDLQAQNETFSSMADHKLYIVYMRRAGELENITAIHLQLLHETLGSAERAHTSLIYSYKHAMNGFSALLTEDHVKTLAAKQGVVQIVPSQTIKPLTTNSWNFLGLPEQESVDIASQNPTIIGVIDSGVNPELPSFSDDRIGPVPTRWNGTCDGGPNFLSSYCNRKLIGVRYYVAGWIAQNQGVLPSESMNAFDTITAHGTHVATTAGGEAVANVQDLNGLVGGTARGGNPFARLAVYKIFWVNSVGLQDGSYADLLKALEDAIADGVDIINLSVSSAPIVNFLTDPISIASFSAMRKNILTVQAAGNSGPEPSTTTAVIPWTITVAATTTNRDLLTTIALLGYEYLIPGFYATFLQDMPLLWYDLVSGQSIQAISATIDDASHCRPGSLDPTKAIGRIVLCKQAHGVSNETNISTKISYLWTTIQAAAAIIVDDTILSNAGFGVLSFPLSIVSSWAGSIISNYIQDSITPMARILQTQAYFDWRAAPVVAGFSSRGPNSVTHNILKPDIATPGASILAGDGRVQAGHYSFMSGTSMAAPHVSGVASLVRAYNGFDAPWSPAAIKSALMTTASPVNSMGTPIMIDAETREANPFDYGSGNMKPLSAINKPGPGLVYDADVIEYVKFLCYMGYSGEEITNVFLVEKADCLGQHNPEMISQINLPSIAIARLTGTTSIQRTLTNVGTAPATYYASAFSPLGVNVTVTPGSLVFSTSLSKNSYTLHFQADPSSTLPATTPRFGSIIWSDGFGHHVRSPIVIQSVFVASNMQEEVM